MNIHPGPVTIIMWACLLQLLLAGPGAAEVLDRIVAVVNEEIITLSELEQMSRMVLPRTGAAPKGREAQALQREMLEALIDRKLARAEAKRRGINVAEREVDQALQEFRARNRLPDDAALTQALAKEGLTLKEFRQQIADQIQQERLVQMAVGAKVTVSEAEVRRVYESQGKGGGTEVHLRTIRLPYPPGATAAQKEETRLKAEEILKATQQRQPLGEIAKRFGGMEVDLGYVPQSDVAPELLEHLNRTRPGEVTPIQTLEGFQFIQVVDRRAGGPGRSFEEAAPEIRQMLMRQEMEKRFADWVKTLREKAHIKIML